jgi:hypothetical protein
VEPPQADQDAEPRSDRGESDQGQRAAHAEENEWRPGMGEYETGHRADHQGRAQSAQGHPGLRIHFVLKRNGQQGAMMEVVREVAVKQATAMKMDSQWGKAPLHFTVSRRHLTLSDDSMQLLLPVLAFSTICFLMAYGTQKRTRWAWYGGWVFGFLAAGAVISRVIDPLLSGQTIFSTVCLIVFGVGGACVWTFWARF